MTNTCDLIWTEVAKNMPDKKQKNNGAIQGLLNC